MEFVNVCPSCKKIYTNEEDIENLSCPNCGEILKPLHMTTQEWYKKNGLERDLIISDIVPEAKNTSALTKNNNIISNALKITGIVTIIAAVISLIGFFRTSESVALYLLLTGILGGLLLLGFSEVIRLLQIIADKNE